MNHFAGEFETHLTVAHSSRADDEDRLRGWAERHGVKYTRIMLDRGATPDQPMLTVRGHGFLYADGGRAAPADRLSAPQIGRAHV